MTRTPEEVFAYHAQALGAGNLDEIVADYADDAVFITSSGIMRGKEGVRQRSPSCSVICRTHPGH